MAYKIVLVGGHATGKTTFAHMARTGELLVDPRPTIGVVVHKIRLDGREFRIWDTAGMHKLRGIGEGYCVGAHGCIAFYSHEHKEACACTDIYVEQFARMCPHAPIVYVSEREDWRIPFRALVELME